MLCLLSQQHFKIGLLKGNSTFTGFQTGGKLIYHFSNLVGKRPFVNFCRVKWRCKRTLGTNINIMDVCSETCFAIQVRRSSGIENVEK